MPRTKHSLARHFVPLRLVLFHPNASLEEANVPLLAADVCDQKESAELELSLPVDPDALRGHLDLIHHLQELFPAGFQWLDQGVIEIVGDFPIDGGGAAEVWVGMMGKRKVAVKSYRYYSASDCLPNYARFCKEALAGSHLRHQNIVPFIGMCSTPEHPLALVYDFMDHSNLGAYLRSNGNVRMLELLSDIAHGVEHMHELGVIHGDINITNILVDPDGRACVAGLGAAYISSLVPGVGIDRFFQVQGAAPELVHPQRFGLPNSKATKHSDMHAFGVLAFEMFTGKAPVFDKGMLVGVQSRLGGRRSPRPNHPELSDRVWEVIKGCLESVPWQRKTIAEVVVALDVELNLSRIAH